MCDKNGISRGEGGSALGVIFGKSRGEGGHRKNPFRGGGYGYFLELHIDNNNNDNNNLIIITLFKSQWI